MGPCLPGFVQKTSSEQLNLLYPNLIWWCIVLSRCVMHKNWDANFKVKVTIRAYIITIWLFQLYQCYNIFWTDGVFFCFFYRTLLVDHHKPKHTLKMSCCCVGQGYCNGSKFNLIQCPDGTLWTAEAYVTEFGTVIHHHEPQSLNVLWKVHFAVFKVTVRITAKVQNVIDCLPRWYLLNNITFCSYT